ncbi:hypothetical protein GY45DRAFT_1224315, partial [Cubamyces sp. BRFM 1775]
MNTSLRIVFHNVNHSPQQTHLVLEQCAKLNVDVVCLQEPWYGSIRPIPSAVPAGPAERTEDNMLYGTQLHPAWQLVENGKDARVVCHVNRRLSKAIVTLDASIKHRDCMILSVRLEAEQDPVVILNVYNDRDNSAVQYLTDHAHELPAIDVAGGDYNTHAPMWDPDYPPDSNERVGEVTELHARLGLRLLSPVGVPTHLPHREDLRSTVIDLVWVPDDRSEELYNIIVDAEGRGLSDHAVIHVSVPAGLWPYQGEPSIAPGSDAEKRFVEAILNSVEFCLPADTPLETDEDARLAVDILYECIREAWNDNATPTKICSKSRLWWDETCSAARDALNSARHWLDMARTHHPDLVPVAKAEVKSAFRKLKSVIRARRRQHMDERIRHIAERQ